MDAASSHEHPPPHGSVGEEAAKLVEAVQDWLGERTGRGARDVWALATGDGEHVDSPECRVCPLCRAMRFFTTMNPEVLEHLVNAATSVSAAMRALSEQHPAEGPVAGRTGQPEDTGHGGVGGSNGSEA